MKAGSRVTKKGDSLDNPEVGTVVRVDGNRAEVDWGWCKGWETLHSLRLAAEPEGR